MTTSRLRLGQLLVDARLITPEALADVLAIQQRDGRRLGTLLVERGHISEVQVTQILSHQLSVPWVSLLKIEFSRQLLNLVPHDVAERYCLLPIYVRRVRGHGDTLYIAMDDPTNEDALRACGAHSGLAVRPMIAPPSDIRNAIRVYYGSATDATLSPPPPAEAPPPADAPAPRVRSQTLRSAIPEAHDAAKIRRASQPEILMAPPAAPRDTTLPPLAAAPRDTPLPPLATAPRDTPLPPLATAPRDTPLPPLGAAPRDTPLPPSSRRPLLHGDATADPVIEVTAVHHPRGPTGERLSPIPSPRGKTPAMVSLTLLDGTTITLPARTTKPPAPTATTVVARTPETAAEAAASLTARDLIAALRAVADGTDASAILGDDVRWEAMFAALLAVLLKKHLIADWEFVEELNKLQKRPPR